MAHYPINVGVLQIGLNGIVKMPFVFRKKTKMNDRNAFKSPLEPLINTLPLNMFVNNKNNHNDPNSCLCLSHTCISIKEHSLPQAEEKSHTRARETHGTEWNFFLQVLVVKRTEY